MTKLQRQYIKDIEKNLNVKYNGGNTREDASLFISLYKEENRKFNLKNKIKTRPTGKQLRLIRSIEQTLEIKFNGKTLNEAKNFIDKYYNEFKANQTYFTKFKNCCNRKADMIDRKRKRRITSA